MLVNNSGVTKTRDPLALTEPEYDELFDVNVRAAYFCAQRSVPHLERRGGSIVNVSSIHGGAGFPGHAAYAATKGALNAFTRALAMDLAPKKIRVNAVAPGLIEVPRYFEMPGYSSEHTARRVPWGRMGEPADVARVVAFLVSPAADDRQLAIPELTAGQRPCPQQPITVLIRPQRRHEQDERFRDPA